jgi:drug/metabolite transporter (DMT)-like permease
VRSRVLKSDALLLAAAAIWGFAFVAQRVGMSHVGPFTFNAVRFALGAVTLLPLLLVRRRAVRSTTPVARLSPIAQVFYGAGLLGTVLFAGASLQQTGIVYTTAGKAGFITGLYVVIVPLLGLLWRTRPSPGAWAGAACATAGLYLLSISGSLEISRGDSLVLGSAVFFAVHVLLAGWLTLRMDPIRLAFYQFCTCSVLSFAAAGATESMALEGIRGAALPILYAGALSVGVAYTLQIVAQREAPPGHVAIILSLEAVFAVIGGGVMLAERIPARGLMGCGLMLAGALLSKLSAEVGREDGAGRQPGQRRRPSTYRSP